MEIDLNTGLINEEINLIAGLDTLLQGQKWLLFHLSPWILCSKVKNGFCFTYPLPIDVVGNIQNQYNQAVLPFEKIKRVVFVKQIPRTDLGKVKVEQLRDNILKGIL